MATSFVDRRNAHSKSQQSHEDTWTKVDFNVELTGALTTLENARMEWNTARLNSPVLAGPAPDADSTTPAAGSSTPSLLATHRFGALCRLGLALTWPLAAVALLALAGLLVILLRR